jgi:tRNA pseudouridine55 synthase
VSGLATDGLLLIDKPGGITSHDAVDRIRRALGIRRVGHAGTLDPMATGLLLVGVGRATRLLRFLAGMPKTYEGTMRLGVRTTTLDADGEVVGSPVDVAVSADDVRGALAALEGDSLQRPPAFSAVKVGGTKLYEAARRGVRVEAEPRPIRVDRFALDAFDGRDARFTVTCSSGTYVRVLAADAGERLGCGAHLSRLRRMAIGPFRVDDATAPDAPGAPRPLALAVAHLPRLSLDEHEAIAARHGRILGPAGIEGPYAVFDPDGELIGVYADDGTTGRPQVILAPA